MITLSDDSVDCILTDQMIVEYNNNDHSLLADVRAALIDLGYKVQPIYAASKFPWKITWNGGHGSVRPPQLNGYIKVKDSND